MPGPILIFDLPRRMNTVKLKVWRDLKKMDARRIQHSVWKHDNLSELMQIAVYIKKNGGIARILEERLLF